jgi:hypothetical protein
MYATQTHSRGNGGKMKRYNVTSVSKVYGGHLPTEIVVTESADGEWVKFSDVPKLDKPAALMALCVYWQCDKLPPSSVGGCPAAIHKLAAAIIAEVEELDE